MSIEPAVPKAGRLAGLSFSFPNQTKTKKNLGYRAAKPWTIVGRDSKRGNCPGFGFCVPAIEVRCI
jgi:hypothetical protein